MSDAEASLMVQARCAAKYLELTSLYELITKELGQSVVSEDKGELGCVCAVLGELTDHEGVESPLSLICLDLIQDWPELCLLPETDNKGILGCSLSLLTTIFTKCDLDAFAAVKCLKKWKEAREDELEADELQMLQDMADSVSLDTITPAQLSELKPCDLFSMERFYEVYNQHGKQKSPAAVFGTPTKSKKFNLDPIGKAFVRGAGVDGANGLYLSQSPGHYCKVQEGTFNDVPSEFFLERIPGAWTLGVSPKDEVETSVLYDFETKGSDALLPSFEVWVCGSGENPPPYVVSSPGYSASVLPTAESPSQIATQSSLPSSQKPSPIGGPVGQTSSPFGTPQRTSRANNSSTRQVVRIRRPTAPAATLFRRT